MPGLFDLFSAQQRSNWMTPEMQRQQQMESLSGLAQGLLAASGPSRMPVSFGQALGQGMQGMQQGRDAYMDRVYKEMVLQSQMQKASQPDLPTGHRWNAEKGEAELIPGVDPSFGKRAPVGMITPYQAFQMQQGTDDRTYRVQKDEQERQRRAEEKAEKEVDAYSSRVDKDALMELLTNTKRLNDAMGNYQAPDDKGNVIKKDIPGFGETGFAPEWALSSEGKTMRQNVSGVANVILKARSGGAVTPQEGDRLLNELGVSVDPAGGLKFSTRTDDQLRLGVANVVTALEDKLTNAATSLSPAGRKLYQERGGKALPGFFGQAPVAPSGFPPRPEENPAVLRAAALPPSPTPAPDASDPRIAKAKAAGYSDEEIRQYLMGRQ